MRHEGTAVVSMRISTLRILQLLLAIPAFILVFGVVAFMAAFMLQGGHPFVAAAGGAEMAFSTLGLAGILGLIGIQVIEGRIKRLKANSQPPQATPQ